MHSIMQCEYPLSSKKNKKKLAQQQHLVVGKTTTRSDCCCFSLVRELVLNLKFPIYSMMMTSDELQQSLSSCPAVKNDLNTLCQALKRR